MRCTYAHLNTNASGRKRCIHHVRGWGSIYKQRFGLFLSKLFHFRLRTSALWRGSGDLTPGARWDCRARWNLRPFDMNPGSVNIFKVLGPNPKSSNALKLIHVRKLGVNKQWFGLFLSKSFILGSERGPSRINIGTPHLWPYRRVDCAQEMSGPPRRVARNVGRRSVRLASRCICAFAR